MRTTHRYLKSLSKLNFFNLNEYEIDSLETMVLLSIMILLKMATYENIVFSEMKELPFL